MPTTRDPCDVSGRYRASCACASFVTAQPGLYFPSCIGCGKAVEWMPDEQSMPLGDESRVVRRPAIRAS